MDNIKCAKPHLLVKVTRVKSINYCCAGQHPQPHLLTQLRFMMAVERAGAMGRHTHR